jgi:probable rRNA maturation factor
VGAIGVTWTVPRAGLSDAGIRRAVRAALEHGGRPGRALDVILVDDGALGELHGRFLADPSATDVIAFDLGDGPGPEGEVYVSVDRACAVAARRNADLGRELSLYVVHGVLHLCGFDDRRPADRRTMRAAEAAVLARLGYAADDAPHEEP